MYSRCRWRPTGAWAWSEQSGINTPPLPETASGRRCGVSILWVAEHPSLALLGGSWEDDLGRVHVPLGDGALRVADSRLDVDLWVAGRRGVRERGVAQVMEGAEGLLDPGAGSGDVGVRRSA